MAVNPAAVVDVNNLYEIIEESIMIRTYLYHIFPNIPGAGLCSCKLARRA